MIDLRLEFLLLFLFLLYFVNFTICVDPQSNVWALKHCLLDLSYFKIIG